MAQKDVLLMKKFYPKRAKRSEKMDKSLFMFAAEGEIHWAIVSVIGIAVVFLGLVCIIGLVSLMTLICDKVLERGKKQAKKTAEAPVAVASPSVVENRGEIIAAVCAAIAEEEGTDISAIRVVSFKKVS